MGTRRLVQCDACGDWRNPEVDPKCKCGSVTFSVAVPNVAMERLKKVARMLGVSLEEALRMMLELYMDDPTMFERP